MTPIQFISALSKSRKFNFSYKVIRLHDDVSYFPIYYTLKLCIWYFITKNIAGAILRHRDRSHILFVLHIHDLLLVSLTVITNHNTLRRSHLVNSGVTSAHLDLVNITDTALSPK